MQAMVDDDNRAVRLKAVVDGPGVPVPNLLADNRRAGFLRRAERIVNQNDIAATAEHSAADTDGVKASPLAGVPFSARTTVFAKPRRVDRLKGFAFDDVADVPAKISGQIERGRGGYELLPGMSSLARFRSSASI